MAKTIKFNLICDEKPVRTLEDIKNNFSIEDVLIAYHNGLLKKWLSVRGYDDELSSVDAIVSEEDVEIIKTLIKIFEIEIDDKKIEEAIYSMNYKTENYLEYEEYKKNGFEVACIIDNYHSGYETLINTIVDNKDDMPKIKAAVKEIGLNYMSLFKLNYRELFNIFIEQAPKGIFAMLMNEDMRVYYLLEENENSVTKKKNNNLTMNIVNDIEKIKETLGDSLCIFAGDTEAYWKDVEPKGKKYMILKMELGNFVRSSGISGGDLKTEDVDRKFIILDGIDYKSNEAAHKLLYMEV